jgi:hypothetical protein
MIPGLGPVDIPVFDGAAAIASERRALAPYAAKSCILTLCGRRPTPPAPWQQSVAPARTEIALAQGSDSLLIKG